jgi:hypothetical protein
MNEFNMVTSNYLHQRATDRSYRHLCYLVRQYDPNVKKTVDEWAKLLLPAAGWKDTGSALGDRKRRVNANDFVMLYKDRMELGPSYTPPATPIPTVCDECKQPCISECICGELFCSRTCLKNAWPGHRSMCELVVENNKFALMMTQIEMSEKLSPVEMLVAMGDEATVKAAAREEKVRQERAQRERDAHRRGEEEEVEKMLAAETDPALR